MHWVTRQVFPNQLAFGPHEGPPVVEPLEPVEAPEPVVLPLEVELPVLATVLVEVLAEVLVDVLVAELALVELAVAVVPPAVELVVPELPPHAALSMTARISANFLMMPLIVALRPLGATVKAILHGAPM